MLLYVDILDYESTKLTTQSVNYVLDSVDSDNHQLLEHLSNYINKHKLEKNFSTYLLEAAHSSNDQDKMNELVKSAINYGKSSGEVTLIKSLTIKNKLLGENKTHNATIQRLVSEFTAESVFPEDLEFYDWKHQEPEPETAAEQEQVESQDESVELNASTEEEKQTEPNEDQQDATTNDDKESK